MFWNMKRILLGVALVSGIMSERCIASSLTEPSPSQSWSQKSQNLTNEDISYAQHVISAILKQNFFKMPEEINILEQTETLLLQAQQSVKNETMPKTELEIQAQKQKDNLLSQLIQEQQKFFQAPTDFQQYTALIKDLYEIVIAKKLTAENFSEKISKFWQNIEKNEAIQFPTAKTMSQLANSLMEISRLRLIKSESELKENLEIWLNILLTHKLASVLDLPRSSEEFEKDWSRFYAKYINK